MKFIKSFLKLKLYTFIDRSHTHTQYLIHISFIYNHINIFILYTYLLFSILWYNKLSCVSDIAIIYNVYVFSFFPLLFRWQNNIIKYVHTGFRTIFFQKKQKTKVIYIVKNKVLGKIMSNSHSTIFLLLSYIIIIIIFNNILRSNWW